jgi:hypothetical protein
MKQRVHSEPSRTLRDNAQDLVCSTLVYRGHSPSDRVELVGQPQPTDFCQCLLPPCLNNKLVRIIVTWARDKI